MVPSVWVADPTLLDNAQIAARCWGWLSHEEQARADRYFRSTDRQTYIAAHALLRAALSAVTGQTPATLEISAEPKGRPRLTGPKAVVGHPASNAGSISLSHTGGQVGAAVSAGGPIGIDVERLDRLAADPIDFARRHFHPLEHTALSQRPGPANAISEQAITIWCLKEAYAKAIGLGLRLSTRETAFICHGDIAKAAQLPASAPSHDWQFQHTRLSSGHMLAIAHTGAAPPVVVQDGTRLLTRSAAS
ncbi:MAG: 4'-phosphopantetheinyl transferase superfamily protein [Pseudomonadota bacterium]